LNVYIFFVFIYLAFAIVSVVLNTPSSLLAWYRISELLVFYLSAIFIVEYFFRNFGYQKTCIELNKFIFLSFKISLAVLLILGIFDPDLVFMSEIQNRLRLGGFAYSPNTLSILFILAQISISYLAAMKKFSKHRYFLWTIIIHILVILTDSRTGEAILIFSDFIILYKFGMVGPLKLKIITFLASLFFIASISLLLFSSIGFELIASKIGSGQDPHADLLTLNNRASVFLTAISGIQNKPIFGYGYVDGVQRFLSENYTLRFWTPPHSHNAFLEIFLSQGIIGGFSLFLILVVSIKKSLSHLLKRNISMEIISSSTSILVVMIAALTTAPIGNVVINLGIIFIVFGYILFLGINSDKKENVKEGAIIFAHNSRT